MNRKFNRRDGVWTLTRVGFLLFWRRIVARIGFQGKTLWDWMQLLMVPVAVVGLATWFQWSTNNAEQKREDDRAQQTVLRSFIQDMTVLLLEKNLTGSNPKDPVRQIARSNVLAAMRQLDGARKGLVLTFLYESGLLNSDSDLIVRMEGVDLRGAELSGVDLSGINLEGVDLTGAKLNGANLENAKFTGAKLDRADLKQTNLRGADLKLTSLNDASMSGADLTNADLREVDLAGATISELRMSRASDLIGATMPDDTVMTSLRWEEFKAALGEIQVNARLQALGPDVEVEENQFSNIFVTVDEGSPVVIPPEVIVRTGSFGSATVRFDVTVEHQAPESVSCIISPGSSIIVLPRGPADALLLQLRVGQVVCNAESPGRLNKVIARGEGGFSFVN